MDSKALEVFAFNIGVVLSIAIGFGAGQLLVGELVPRLIASSFVGLISLHFWLGILQYWFQADGANARNRMDS